MAKDIEMDFNRLATDLSYMANGMLYSPKQDLIKYDLNGLMTLNESIVDLTGYGFDLNMILENNPEATIILNRHNCKSIEKFYSFFYANKDLLLEITKNYAQIVKDTGFTKFLYYDVLRKYNQEEFKEIILSFYSQFGNEIYEIVKMYFDEQRIQTGYFEMADFFAAFYSSIRTLCSGYLFTTDSAFNSHSITSVVHEFGHAIDAERFIFPQQKTISILEDPYVEVPSTCFEDIFTNYLVKQKIDTTGGQVLDNVTYTEMLSYFETIAKGLSMDKLEADMRGNILNSEENMNIRDSIIYGLGHYFAQHLKLIQREDNEEFLRIYNNLITGRKERTFEEAIKTLAIPVEDFVSGKYIKEEMSNHTRTIKKRFNYNS